MRERGQPFFFLPMFGFADETAIVQPATQADDAELRHELIGRLHLDKLYEQARQRMLADMTGTSFDEHMLRTTIEAAVEAILPILYRREAAAHAAGVAVGLGAAIDACSRAECRNPEDLRTTIATEICRTGNALKRGQHGEQG